MIASGYVFPPLGVYLMWRYRDWSPRTKAAITVIGLCLAAISTIISSTYIMPHLF